MNAKAFTVRGFEDSKFCSTAKIVMQLNSDS
jgi:hypothetical protein